MQLLKNTTRIGLSKYFISKFCGCKGYFYRSEIAEPKQALADMEYLFSFEPNVADDPHDWFFTALRFADLFLFRAMEQGA
jgi:hypothetical protein